MFLKFLGLWNGRTGIVCCGGAIMSTWRQDQRLAEAKIELTFREGYDPSKKPLPKQRKNEIRTQFIDSIINETGIFMPEGVSV